MPPRRTKHFYDNSSSILQPSTATLCQSLASGKFNSTTWPTNALPFLLFPGIISQQLQHFPTPNHFPKISQTFCYHVVSLNHNQSTAFSTAGHLWLRFRKAAATTEPTRDRPPEPPKPRGPRSWQRQLGQAIVSSRKTGDLMVV